MSRSVAKTAARTVGEWKRDVDDALGRVEFAFADLVRAYKGMGYRPRFNVKGVHGNSLFERLTDGSIDPADITLQVWFEEDPDAGAGELGVSEADGPADPVGELIRSLARVEDSERLQFIALTRFRDTMIPAACGPWAQDERRRREVLVQAINEQVVTSYKVPNARNPEFPVTAVKLNRMHPRVVQILGRGPVNDDFEPVPIRGEPLSETVVRDRR